MEKLIIIGTLILEYFLWVAWLKKDGFTETAQFQETFTDAIRYTWYRFYFSLPKIKASNSIYCTTLLAEMNKQKRTANGTK